MSAADRFRAVVEPRGRREARWRVTIFDGDRKVEAYTTFADHGEATAGARAVVNEHVARAERGGRPTVVRPDGATETPAQPPTRWRPLESEEERELRAKIERARKDSRARKERQTAAALREAGTVSLDYARNLTSDLRDARAERDEARIALAAARAERDEARAALKEARADLSDLRAGRARDDASMRRELKEARAEVETLRVARDALHLAYDRARTALNQAVAERDEARSDLAAGRRGNHAARDLSDLLEKARADRDQARVQAHLAEDARCQAAEHANALLAMRDSAMSDLKSALTRSDRYRLAWEDNRNRRRTAARALTALRARNQALLTDLEEARREIARQDAARRDNIALRASHDAVVNSHRSMHAAATRHFTRRRTAARAIAALRARNAALNAEIDRATRSLEASRDLNATLRDAARRYSGCSGCSGFAASAERSRRAAARAITALRARTARADQAADLRTTLTHPHPSPPPPDEVLTRLQAVHRAAFEAAVLSHNDDLDVWLARQWPTLWGTLTALMNASQGVTHTSPLWQHAQVANVARDLRALVRNAPALHRSHVEHLTKRHLWEGLLNVAAAVDRLDAALIRHHYDPFGGARRTPPAGSFTYQQGPTTPAPGITAAVIDATDDD